MAPSIVGFKRLNAINEDPKTIVFRALRESDSTPVVLKMLRNDHPTLDEIAALYHQFDISHQLDLPGVIKSYDLIKEDNHYILVQEDIKGISLREYMYKNPLSLDDFFVLAKQVLNILNDLHRQHIVHKDVKPDNFIIQPDTLTVKITDFHIATKLSYEIQDIVNPDRIEGTLAYMAPEQTGRMNIHIDYRSDYYALGVMFYEMLTGQLPFNSDDPLEMIYAHTVSQAQPMFEINPNIPPMLNSVVQKLMAKHPIKRYQSVIGILSDIEQCKEQWGCTRDIEEFAIGKADVCDRLNISQKLYGRLVERQTLLDAYDRVSEGATEALMIKGYSGIGKTMLVNEVHKAMVQHAGYFISGKFDQLKRNKPYSAITVALNSLARQIMTENDTRFDELKKRLIESVGSVGQLIVNIAPDMELVIGKQDPLPDIGPRETHNRLQTFFRRFIHAMTSDGHPLVIFIDDLQWIDSGSLSLLEYILTDETLNHVLIIGAYRENSVDNNHPLTHLIDQLTKQHKQYFEKKGEGDYAAPLEEVTIGPLSVEDFENLLIDTFERDAKMILPLAKLLHTRTHGNPFFVKQVVITLYHQDALTFDYDERHWSWNLGEIDKLKITDNVVDLMINKVSELPRETQQLLTYAACLGSRFTVEKLTMISEKPGESVGEILWPAMESELILSLQLGYKRLEAMADEKLAASISKEMTYQFAHDRVLQAVYQLMSEKEKQQTHLVIARLLLNERTQLDANTGLFEIVDHFNHAAPLLNDKERFELAKFNHIAAVRAKNANAYQSMHNYINAGLDLTESSWWEIHYEVMFDLHREYAHSLYLTGELEKAKELTEDILTYAKTVLDQVSIYQIQVMQLRDQGLNRQSLKVAQKALSLLGVHIIIKPTKYCLLRGIVGVEWRLRKFDVNKLEQQLSEVTDEKAKAAFGIIAEIVVVTYMQGPKLFAEISLWAMRLMLKFGRPSNAGLWSGSYAFVTLSTFQNIKKAFRFWRLTERFYDQNMDKYSYGLSAIAYSYLLNHHLYPYDKAKDILKKAVITSQESGNKFTTLMLDGQFALIEVAKGESLIAAHEYQKKSAEDCLKYKIKDFSEINLINQIAQERQILDVTDDDDEMIRLDEQLKAGQNPQLYLGNKRGLGGLYFFLGQYDKAIDQHEIWYAYKNEMQIDILSVYARISYGLSLIKVLPKASWLQRYRYKKALLEIESFIQTAAERCPGNYQHYVFMLKAGRAQLNGQYEDAFVFYDQAIAHSKEHRYNIWSGIANQFAAELHIKLNRPRAAIDYLQEACYYFRHYGAQANVNILTKKYGDLLKKKSRDVQYETMASDEKTDITKTMQLSSSNTTSSHLDFLAVVKASQTISGEIVWDKLLQKMLHIAIESVGADRALFIEHQKSQWNVIAEMSEYNDEQKFTTHNTLIKAFKKISHPIVNYAIRSLEPIVISNAFDTALYKKNWYVMQARMKSVMCMPIHHHNDLVGILYLENRSTEAAFTNERVELLNTLSLQIAISLENSKNIEQMQTLYKATERFVPKRFLQLLDKEHVEDVKLGDSIKKNLTIMFTDIRGYTTITEKLTPEESFGFINDFLKVMGPIIRKHAGFINQYQGDAIMALFPRSPEDGITAVIEMAEALVDYNKESKQQGKPEIKVGYGLNTGPVMLGTIGEQERMDANVISDAINLASRIESLNKFYGTEFLISDATWEKLANKKAYKKRRIDKVRVKGKQQSVYLYEIYLHNHLADEEQQFIDQFETAFKVYEQGDFEQASKLFHQCAQLKPNDKATQDFISRCDYYIKEGAPDNWDGTYTLMTK